MSLVIDGMKWNYRKRDFKFEPNNLNLFGEFLYYILKNKNKDVSWLCSELDIRISTFNKLVRKGTRPSKMFVAACCGVLDLNFERCWGFVIEEFMYD